MSHINANYLFLSGSQHHLLEESLFGCQQYSDREIIKAWNMAQQCGITLRPPRLFGETSAKPTACPPKRSPCAWPWEYFELYTSGVSAICCSGAGICSNAATDNFYQMWNGAQRQEIRRTVNTANELDCCRNCSSSTQRNATSLRNFVAGGDEQELLRYFASLPDPV